MKLDNCVTFGRPQSATVIIQLMTELDVSNIRGSFFMFVELGCISTNMNLRYYKYIYFERSSFCLSTDVNFISLALSSVKIYSFE